MKPTALIRFACAVVCMLCVSSLSGQFPGRPSLIDDEQPAGGLRANQRILPLPSGEPGVLQQIELLERLNGLADDQRQSSPELTESQLKMLDRVVKSFQNDAGELELPNLDMLPPGLLGNLMSDPVQRQKARRLLEQYARQRNLGIPGTNPTLPKLPTDRERGQASGQTSEPAFTGRTSNPFEKNDQGVRNPASNSGSGPTEKRPDNSGLAQSLEPNRDLARETNRERIGSSPRLDELRDIENLLKNLRSIDEAQTKSASNKTDTKGRATGDTAGRSNASRANPARPSAGPSRTRGPSRTTNGQAQITPRSNRLQPPIDGSSGQRYPGMPPIPNTFPPMPEVDGQFDSASADRDRGPGGNGQSGGAGSNLGSALEEQSFKLDVNELDQLDPFRENRKSPSDPNSAANPFADPSATNRNRNAAPPRGFRVKELAESLQPSPTRQGNGVPGSKGNNYPTPSKDNSTGSDAGGQSSRGQSNSLVQSLRGLVNKALQEQGHDERSARELLRESTRGLIPGSQRSNADALTNAGKDESVLKLPSNSGMVNARDGKSSAGNNNTALDSNATSTAAAPSVPTAWRSLIQDVWRSITIPPTSTTTTMPSVRTFGSGTMPSLSDFFNTRVLSVLAAAALALATIYWLAHRGQLKSDPSSDVHERWVREVLTYGLKTRADVVRAFHLFVMQTSQPVAAWWNHRHVARQLAAASPQMGAALDELAGVYEQARYTPPDVPLQAEQLERMRLALEQCRRS